MLRHRLLALRTEIRDPAKDVKGGGGVVLSAASVVAILGNLGRTNYVASKAGIIGMTRTWARELGKYKIRINAVAPGFIATDMVRAMNEKVLQAMVPNSIGQSGNPGRRGQ